MEMFAVALAATQQLVEGVQEYQQGRYEAEVAKSNMNVALENASRSRIEAGLAEEAKRREARMELGRAAAAGAQSGVAGGGLGVGSVGAVLSQSARMGELDALNIRYAGLTEGAAHEAQAAQFKMERRAAIQRARGGLVSGVLGSATKVLMAPQSNYAPNVRPSVTQAPMQRPRAAAPVRTKKRRG